MGIDGSEIKKHKAIPANNTVLAPKKEKEKTQKIIVLQFILVFIVGSVLGYFGGREHIKYELRSAFNKTAADISKGIKESFKMGIPEGEKTPQLSPSKSETYQPPPPVKKREIPITATLVKKGWANKEYDQHSITFTVSLTNVSGKNIRAFDGGLIFTDLLGNEILRAKLAINDPINSGKAFDWVGGIDYNQFKDSHERLRDADIQNLKIDFETRKILFEDGEVKEFQ